MALDQQAQQDQSVSILKRYAIGLVAFPKATDSDEVQVTIKEMTPYMSGEVTVNPQVIEAETVDESGGTTSEKVVTDSTIKATWLPMGSNRRTSPDVMVGERVQIYRFGDEDKYFWKELGLDDNLRRLETVIFAISGKPTVAEDADISDSDWYFVEWSSHKKHLMVANSKSNDEQVQYVGKFDYGEGKFSIADDLNNSLVLDSIERVWQMINGDNTMVKIDKKNIELIAQQDILFTAIQNIRLLCENLHITANQLIEMISETNKTTCTTWSVDANTASITAPGGIKLNGPISHTGGDTNSDGNYTTSQDVKAGGISLRGHRHGGVQSGGSMTNTPS